MRGDLFSGYKRMAPSFDHSSFIELVGQELYHMLLMAPIFLSLCKLELRCSRNEAKYEVLIIELIFALKMAVCRVWVQGDSKLIIKLLLSFLNELPFSS